MKVKYSVFQMQTRCGGADFNHLATILAETPRQAVDTVVKRVNAKLKAKDDDYRLVIAPKSATEASVKMPEGSVELTYFLTEALDPSESIVVLKGSVTAEQAQAIVDKDLEQVAAAQKAVETRQKNLAHKKRSDAAKKAWVTIRAKKAGDLKAAFKPAVKKYDETFDKEVKKFRPEWLSKGSVQKPGRVNREKATVKK
jgi:hypothetical protein